MAETSVTNQICRHCGADVRLNTQFCYNCGGAVAPDAAAFLQEETAVNSPLRENIVGSVNGDYSKQTNKLDIAGAVEKPIDKSEAQEEVQLKSAASLRRKSKIAQPKKVEVIWEEHENAPNVWFILVAITLTIFAAVILYLAMRLR